MSQESREGGTRLHTLVRVKMGNLINGAQEVIVKSVAWHRTQGGIHD